MTHSLSMLRAQTELVDCALRRSGFSAVMDGAVTWAHALFDGAACAVVIVDDNDKTLIKSTADFPPALLAESVRQVNRAPGLDASDAKTCHVPVIAGQHVLLRSEPIRFTGSVMRGALLIYSDQAQRTENFDELVSAVATSIGLAINVALHERQSLSADEKLTSLTAAIPGVVYQRVVTSEGDIRYTYISESAYDLFGVSAKEIVENPNALFAHYSPEYRDGFRERLIAASRALTTWDVEASILMADGQRKYTHAIARPALQDDGSVMWTGIIMDATRIKKTEAAVAAAEASTRHAIIESLSQGFMMYDRNDRLIVCNSHYLKLYPELAGMIGPDTTYHDIALAEAKRDANREQDETQWREEHDRRLVNHSDTQYIFECQLSDDKWLLVNEHRDSHGGTIVLYTDISDLKSREWRMKHIAHHDALTDLPNRKLFREKLEESLQRSAQTGAATVVFCLDLDHFKDVNDTLGHPAGDALLKIIAKRLAGCLRATDTVARLGGDEFAIIVTDVPTPDFVSGLATRLLNAVIQPVLIDGNQVLTAASIGVAHSGPDNLDADRIIKSADMALYRAKTDGRNTHRYFEPDMDVKAQARRAMEMDLRMAITRNEMELHYQPVVEIGGNVIVAFEALIRWTHPTRGKVPPIDFIGFAEETGLIRKLGEWILRRACSVAVTWPAPVRVAVNLSPAQFKDRDLADTILKILKETQLPPNRLELEITESLLLSDTDANLATLHRLKDAGIRISMDDFGTGYSSLGSLRSFPFDKIKIDQSFIRDMETNPDSAAIVRAVLGLGSSLGVGMIAEGVETESQMLRLKEEGCTQIQGYYYSKARPADEAAAMLAENIRQPDARIGQARLDPGAGDVPSGDGQAPLASPASTIN